MWNCDELTRIIFMQENCTQPIWGIQLFDLESCFFLFSDSNSFGNYVNSDNLELDLFPPVGIEVEPSLGLNA